MLGKFIITLWEEHNEVFLSFLVWSRSSRVRTSLGFAVSVLSGTENQNITTVNLILGYQLQVTLMHLHDHFMLIMLHIAFFSFNGDIQCNINWKIFSTKDFTHCLYVHMIINRS